MFVERTTKKCRLTARKRYDILIAMEVNSASKANSLAEKGEKRTADATAITINCDPWIYFMTYNIFKSIFHCHNVWIYVRVSELLLQPCIKCSLNMNSWGCVSSRNEKICAKCGGKSKLLMLVELPHDCFHASKCTKSSWKISHFIFSLSIASQW